METYALSAVKGPLQLLQRIWLPWLRGKALQPRSFAVLIPGVGPEHILDQGFGEIVVVRVAGNIAGLSELGSLEYAVKHLKVPLLLVLGHEECGAVKAALQGEAPGAVGELIKEIGPAVRPVLDQEEEVEDVVLEAVQANVWHTMGKLIERSPVIAEAVQSGSLMLTGAVYSLTTSQVAILEEEG